MATGLLHLAPLFLAPIFAGVGFPLGIPPAAEDPQLGRAAPADCVFYATWCGSSEPSAASGNRAEQLLAEAEVQAFSAHMEKTLRGWAQQEPVDNENPGGPGEVVVDALKTWLRRPSMFYISGFKPIGDRYRAEGAMLISLGDETPAVRKMLDEHIRPLMLFSNVESLDTETIDGSKWYRIHLHGDWPRMRVGIKDKYFVLLMGNENLDDLFARMRHEQPAWLTAAEKRVPVGRSIALTYVDIRRMVVGMGMVRTPSRKSFLAVSGLDQVTGVISASGVDGNEIITRTAINIQGEPRGLLHFARSAPLRPEDLRAIPSDATLAVAARFDVQKAIDEVLENAEKQDEPTRAAVKNELDRWNRDYSLDLRHGIIRSLGDTWHLYNSPREGGIVASGLTITVPIVNHNDFSHGYVSLSKGARKAWLADGADPFGIGPLRPRQFRFANNEVKYISLGEWSPALAPTWCHTDRELVVSASPQSMKGYLGRPATDATLDSVPEVAELFKPGGTSKPVQPDSGAQGPLLIAYLDTPRMFEVLYPLLTMMTPAMLGGGNSEMNPVDLTVLPSTSSIGRHLRPCLMTLRRTSDGLETYTRATVPGIGLLGPACVAIWHEDWAGLNANQGAAVPGAAAPGAAFFAAPQGMAAGGPMIGPVPAGPPPVPPR